MASRNQDIYSVRVHSTRAEYDTFRFDLTPEQNALENDYYGTYFTVTVLSRGQECARLRGKLFDETLVYASAQDLLAVADAFGKAESGLASFLNGSKELQIREGEWQKWDKEQKQPVHRGYSGYIQVLFVDEAFRGKGIATYLLTNLHKILRHTLGIKVRAVAISPAPLADAAGTLLAEAGESVLAKEGKKRTFSEGQSESETLDFAEPEGANSHEGANNQETVEILTSVNGSILAQCGYHEIMEESDAGMYTGNYDDFTLHGTGCWVRVYPVV